MKMRVAALTSGGKDSIYAAYLVSSKHELCAFLTALPTSEEARLFHFPNAKLVKLQARACGLEFLSLRTEVGEKAEREALPMSQKTNVCEKNDFRRIDGPLFFLGAGLKTKYTAPILGKQFVQAHWSGSQTLPRAGKGEAGFR